MIIHNIILEMPWLKLHNSDIDWEKRIFTFERCNCVIDLKFMYRQRSIMNEKQMTTSQSLCSTKKIDFKKEIASTITVKSLMRQEVKKNEEIHAFSDLEKSSRPKNRIQKTSERPPTSENILDKYDNWKHFFREELNANALPKHQSWDHEIRLISEKQPTFGLIYALSNKKLEVLREYLKINEKKEFIRKSKFSTEYSILFVFKKNGKLRLCVDYRKLNEIIIKNWYSLFNIKELQDRLTDVKWFIKLNLREAYNLIWIKTEKEWKTVFRIRYDLYEYTVMSFKLINASTNCQKLFNNTLREYLNIFVIVYWNDILIFFQIIEEHEQHIKKVLECLSKRDLLIKSEKCDWYKKEVDFLKFIIEINDVRMNFDKLTSVKTWSIFINIKEMQAFPKFVDYNRKFIQGYSQKIMILTNLTIKNRLWKWNEDEQTTFERLRNACLSNSILRMIDISSSIKIETDASDLVIEACFNQ